MKCTSCSHSWLLEPGQALTCPQCGSAAKPESLIDGLLAASKVIDAEQLKDGKILFSVFTDLAPELKKERNLLKVFIDAGGPAKLYAVKDGTNAEKDAARKALVRTLSEDWNIAENNASAVCKAYLYAATGKMPRGGSKAKKPAESAVKDADKKTVSKSAKNKAAKKPKAVQDPVPPKTEENRSGFGFIGICLLILAILTAFLYFDILPSVVIPLHILTGCALLFRIIFRIQSKKKK